MCLILIIGVIAPLVYMLLLIAEDLTVAYRTLLAALRDENEPLLDSWRKYPVLAALADTLQNLERLTGSDLRTSIAENVAELGKVLVGQVTRRDGCTVRLRASRHDSPVRVLLFSGRGCFDRLASLPTRHWCLSVKPC